MKHKSTVCIDVPKERVWEVLADVAVVNLWVEPIRSARCEGSRTRGVGTTRVCNLVGGMTVKETWTAWEEGHSFTYEAESTAMFKRAANTWSVKAVNGKTLLTTESEVTLKGGIFGRLLEPLMRIMTTRVGTDSLAALKYLAETGQPFPGKPSELPQPPAQC